MKKFPVYSLEETIDYMRNHDDDKTPYRFICDENTVRYIAEKFNKYVAVKLFLRIWRGTGKIIGDFPEFMDDWSAVRRLLDFGHMSDTFNSKTGECIYKNILTLPEKMSTEYFVSLFKSDRPRDFYLSGCVVPDVSFIGKGHDKAIKTIGITEDKIFENKMRFFKELRSYDSYDFFLDKFDSVDLKDFILRDVIEVGAHSVHYSGSLRHFTKIYFDYLEFVINNSKEDVRDRTKQIVRDIIRKFWVYFGTDSKHSKYSVSPEFIHRCSKLFNLTPQTVIASDRYAKIVSKNGATSDDLLTWFSSNTMALITSKQIPDDKIEENINKSDINSSIIKSLMKNRSELFSKISGDILEKSIRKHMLTGLPPKLKKYISDGIIDIDLKIKYDSDSLNLLMDLEGM